MMDNQNSTTNSEDDQASQQGPLKQWSKRILGLTEGDDDSRGTRLLATIQSDGFLPPVGHDAALRAHWSDKNDHVDRHTRSVIRSEKHGIVTQWIAEFEDQFFHLSVTERRQRWNDLMKHCRGFPVLERRIQRLEGGLEAQPGNAHPELIAPGSIGDYFQQLFVADRSRMPSILAAYEESVLSKPSEVSEAFVEDLERYHPAIAALRPQFRDEFVDRQGRSQRRARARIRREKLVNRSTRSPELSAGSVIWLALCAAVALIGFINIGNRQAGSKANDTSPWDQNSSQWLSNHDLEERLLVRPDEQPVDAAARRAHERPHDLDAQHRLGKELIDSALAWMGSVNGIMTVRTRTEDERETIYLQACEVLQPIVVAEPSNLKYAETFFQACERYIKHPSYLETVSTKLSNIAELPNRRSQYFRQLAKTHRERHRDGEAIATLVAMRELSIGEPIDLVRIAMQLAIIAWSPETDINQPEQVVVDQASREFFVTVESLWNELCRAVIE